MDEPITVVLADDHAIVRAGLNAVLRAATDIQVVGEATNGLDAVSLTEQLDPTVLVADVLMGGMDGITVTRQVVEKGLRARVLILTMITDSSLLVKALEAGASGYLGKSSATSELVSAIRAVARGDVYVQPAAAGDLAHAFSKPRPTSEGREKYEQLTERERAVLGYIAAGFSAPEIGEKLFISPKTVDTYRQRVNKKLGLSHRHEYVTFALKLNLLQA